MSIWTESTQCKLNLNLDDITAILDYMAEQVTLGDPKRKASISVSLNGTSYESIAAAKKWIGIYEDKYAHRGAFVDQMRSLELEVKCVDSHVKDWMLRGYRKLGLEINNHQNRIICYSDDRVGSPGFNVEAIGNLFLAYLKQYQLKTPPVKAVKVVGLSTAGLMAVGGLLGGILITPFALPVIVVGGAIAATSLIVGNRKFSNNISFLPAPVRNTDVLVDVVR